MSRILIVAVIAFFYGSPSLAAEESLISDKFQFTLATYDEGQFDSVKSNDRTGNYRQLENKNAPIEEVKPGHLPERKMSAPGTGIGLEVASLFGTYGVFRTSIKNDKSTYFAIGVTAEELSTDETDSTSGGNDGVFSYGFGVNNSAYNIEYMVYMDEENYGVSAISLGFNSEF